MSFNLSNFNILGLHGDMDVNISLNDNKLVIVAENGLGKTTIVNILYYTLSQQWYKLTEYQFHRIEFTINESNFSFQRDELDEYTKIRKLRGRSDYRRRLGPKLSTVADFILENNLVRVLIDNPKEVELIASRFDVPSRVIFDVCNELLLATNPDIFTSNLEEITSFLNKEIKAQILYLPTYRRIEKDLKNIFLFLKQT